MLGGPGLSVYGFLCKILRILYPRLIFPDVLEELTKKNQGKHGLLKYRRAVVRGYGKGAA